MGTSLDHTCQPPSKSSFSPDFWPSALIRAGLLLVLAPQPPYIVLFIFESRHIVLSMHRANIDTQHLILNHT
jgi:hypothetical protein